MGIYANCLEKGIPPQVTDKMDVFMYIKTQVWQLSQIYPIKGKKTKAINTIEDWIY